MTGKFLRVTWFHFYDDLGRNLLVNLFWVLGCCLPLPVIGIPLAACALCHYAERLISFDDPSPWVFWEGYKKYFLRGLLFGWGYILLVLPIGFSVLFYMLKTSDYGLWTLIPAGICLWIVTLYVMAAQYFFVFTVHQSKGFGTTLKRACLAVLMRPGMSFCSLVLATLWLLVSLLIPPLLLIVPAIWWGISGTVALRILLEEYDNTVPDTPLPDNSKSGTVAKQTTERSDFAG